MYRLDERIRKVTLWDWLLHIFGIHLVRHNSQGELYCRLCSKNIDEKLDKIF